ncbi:MAG: hypothetical protein WDN27_02325 [Candidatus Saccharibacteria bacterium]
MAAEKTGDGLVYFEGLLFIQLADELFGKRCLRLIDDSNVERHGIVTAVQTTENEQEDQREQEGEKQGQTVAEQALDVDREERPDGVEFLFQCHSCNPLPVRSMNTSSRLACSTFWSFLKPRPGGL